MKENKTCEAAAAWVFAQAGNWNTNPLGMPKIGGGGLIAEAEACTVTSLLPLLLKLVKNLYKIRQAYVKICLKGSFSHECEKQAGGCSQ